MLFGRSLATPRQAGNVNDVVSDAKAAVEQGESLCLTPAGGVGSFHFLRGAVTLYP
jgi:hypothetical protein